MGVGFNSAKQKAYHSHGSFTYNRNTLRGFTYIEV